MTDDDPTDDDSPPWFARGHANALQGAPCTPRSRERLWTLVKAGKRVDAELLFHAEHGVELQLAHEGVMAYARRWTLRQYAVEDAEDERRRLVGEGWTQPQTKVE